MHEHEWLSQQGTRTGPTASPVLAMAQALREFNAAVAATAKQADLNNDVCKARVGFLTWFAGNAAPAEKLVILGNLGAAGWQHLLRMMSDTQHILERCMPRTSLAA